MSGQIQSHALTQQLARHLARSVDVASQARAQSHLVDWLGCAVAGAAEPVGKILRKVGIDSEAFIWGGLGNILEMDDVDKRAILHPGPTIIPAALASACEIGVSGPDLLEAIVRGYEATIRLGRATGPGHYAIWHSTATCGPIGAAAACASLRELDEKKTAQALALSMSQTTGLWQTRHEAASHGKQLHTAHAARAGFDAARLAAAGMCGPLHIIEGEQGFFTATCSDADPKAIMAEYESDWLIHDVSFKPWPACRHAHAAIDAALDLAGQTKAGGDNAIHVRTYPDALKFCDNPDPKTPIEAKFSLQHAVAVCLVRGQPTLDDSTLAAIAEPYLAHMRARVQVEAAEPYSSAYPARYGAEVSIGDIAARVPDALGDPENPVSEGQLRDKATTLMQVGGMEDVDADDLIDAAFVLHQEKDTRGFIETIRGALS